MFGLYDLKRRQLPVQRTAASGLVPGTDITIKGHTVLRFPDMTEFTANSPYYLLAIPESEFTNNPNL